jgi:hypothetical protein
MSPEVALTGNDVTGSQVTESDVITGIMFCACPKGKKEKKKVNATSI